MDVARIPRTDSDETQIPNPILNYTWSKDSIQNLFWSLLYHQNNTFMYSLNQSETGIHELNKSEQWIANMIFNRSYLLSSAAPSNRKTIQEDLRFLTDESLISRGPLVFMLVLMMMIGGTVNTVVTLVFSKRFPASALRSFIVTLSVSDLVATMVGIPCYVYTILNVYSFFYPSLCKFFFLVTSLSTNLSSFVTVMFAVDRLRRVQSPTFKETDKIRSYYQMAFVVLLATVVTAPFVPLFGIYKTPTYSRYKAHICWIDTQYKNSNYQSIYTAVLGATFGLGFSLIAFSYGTIGYKIHVLTRDIKEELIYLLDNPPPPNKYMYIYGESPLGSFQNLSEVQLPGVKVSEIRLQIVPPAEGEPGRKRSSAPTAAFTFAERLHGPRMNMLQPGELGVEPDGQIRKTSRIKKISTAIQTFFNPEALPTKSSVTGSSFISQRGFGTFAKSVEVTGKHWPAHYQSHKQMKQLHQIPGMLPGDAIRTSPKGAYNPDSSFNPSSLTEEDDLRDIKDPAYPNEDDKRTSTVAAITAGVISRYLNINSSAAGDPVVKREPWKVSEPGPSTLGGAQQTVTTQLNTQGSTPVSPYLTTDSMVTRPNTSTVPQGEADKGEGKGETRERRRTTSSNERRKTRISLIQGNQLRMEAMATLAQLDKIRKSSRNTMIILVVLFACTWVPNLVARVMSSEPAYLCKKSMVDCWTNVGSYAISSVFFNSTFNAFFYCFGSVHFRKQVKFFFQPCKERICPRKKRRMVVRVVRQKAQQAPPMEPGQEPVIESPPPRETASRQPKKCTPGSRTGPTSRTGPKSRTGSTSQTGPTS